MHVCIYEILLSLGRKKNLTFYHSFDFSRSKEEEEEEERKKITKEIKNKMKEENYKSLSLVMFRKRFTIDHIIIVDILILY